MDLPKGTYVRVAELSGQRNYLITSTTTKILPLCFRLSFEVFLPALTKSQREKLI